MADSGTLCYEQPLNERTRTLLRLEHLIKRLRFHEPDASIWGRRNTVHALIDILSLMARYDTRGEIAKELDTRRSSLLRWQDSEAVDRSALERTTEQLRELGQAMHGIPPQFAAYRLRNDELLKTLASRSAMPGGDCSFDVPGFSHWLSLDDSRRIRDIAEWSHYIADFERAIDVLLRLLRDSATADEHVAENGVHVHRTPQDTQLIRVLLSQDDIYPEISGGRHRATIRFVSLEPDTHRTVPMQSPISFRMACCRL